MLDDYLRDCLCNEHSLQGVREVVANTKNLESGLSEHHSVGPDYKHILTHPFADRTEVDPQLGLTMSNSIDFTRSSQDWIHNDRT